MHKPFALPPVGALIEIDPGRGNLSAKAYFASIIGPTRVAHSARSAKTLVANTSTLLAQAATSTDQVAYVSVELPADTAGPLVAVFAGSDPSTPTGVSVELTNTLGAPGGRSFAAILLPGESLFARAFSGSFNVVVGVSYF